MQADMTAHLKANKEFAKWLEQWLAKIDSRASLDNTPPGRGLDQNSACGREPHSEGNDGVHRQKAA